MITCPNCEKEIADDTVHCGYCGHKIQDEEQKKTMFGMAALGEDELEKAVEKAKEARGEGGDSSPEKKGGLKLPKPGQKSGNKSPSRSSGESSGLSIPKPNSKLPKPGEDAQESEEDRGAPLAPTERMDLDEVRRAAKDDSNADVGGGDDAAEPGGDRRDDADPAGGEEPAPSAQGNEDDAPEADDDSARGDASRQEPSPPLGEPPGPDAMSATSGGESSGAQSQGAKGESAGASQEQAPLGEPSGPAVASTDFDGGSPPGPALDQQDADGDIGQREIDPGQRPVQKKKKSNTKLIIGVFALVFLGGLGCMAAVAAYFFLGG